MILKRNLFRVVLAISAFCASIAAADRTTINFNYGWRFHYGPTTDDKPGPGVCEFEEIDNYECEVC